MPNCNSMQQLLRDQKDGIRTFCLIPSKACNHPYLLQRSNIGMMGKNFVGILQEHFKTSNKPEQMWLLSSNYPVLEFLTMLKKQKNAQVIISNSGFRIQKGSAAMGI